MLYLIGLGLNEKGISREGMTTVKKCKRVYLDSYTVDFPYSFEELQQELGKKIVKADRDFIENLKFLGEAKKMDVALLVYGSPLTATTHISIISEAIKEGIKYKVIYGASVLDAVAETGLQLYRFGKIASMPRWSAEKNFEPDSFMEIVDDNKKIGAHSLILIDIGLELNGALKQLEKAAQNHNIRLGKILICSALGNQKSHIFYDGIEKLKDKEVRKPYCIIIPGKLHFLEKEIIEGYN
jgi:diphthine synthase